MDQLTLSVTRLELSTAFQVNFKKNKIFNAVIQNHNLLITLVSFLDTSEVLNLALLNKQIKTIIQKSTTIQNRLLKAQLKYLTSKQQNRIQKEGKKIQANSAYSLFQTYWDSLPISIQERYQNLHQDKVNPLNSLIFVLGVKRFSKNMSKKESTKNPRSIQTKNGEVTPQNNEYPSIEELVNEDKEYQMLQNWEKQAELEKKRKFEENLKRYQELTPEQKKQWYLSVKKKQATFYPELADPDQTLILGKQTIWDRIKKAFR